MPAISIRQAKALCSSSEYELVLWSTNTRVRELDASRLRAKRDRSRRLRDKFRDLANQQRREMRGKGTARRTTPASDNRNTLNKAQLFQETIDRFEAAMDALTKAKAKTAKKPAAKKAGKKASRKPAAKKAARVAGTKKPPATSMKVTKKITKKITKQTAKKTSKKTPVVPKKPVGRSPASVLSSSGAAGKKPARKASASPTPALASRQASRRTQSAAATRKTKSKKFDRTGTPKIHGHISSRDRRSQSRRDARN